MQRHQSICKQEAERHARRGRYSATVTGMKAKHTDLANIKDRMGLTLGCWLWGLEKSSQKTPSFLLV